MINFPFLKKKKEPVLPPFDMPPPGAPPASQFNSSQKLDDFQRSQAMPNFPPPELGPAGSPGAPPVNPFNPQLGIKPLAPPGPIPDAPAPPTFNPPDISSTPDITSSNPSGGSATLLTEDVEKIAEGIINEKWAKVREEIDKLEEFKHDVEGEVTNLQASIDKLDKKLQDVQNAIMGKVEEYNKSISNVNTELQAMSKVFDKVMPTFTDNVKQLDSIIKKAKK